MKKSFLILCGLIFLYSCEKEIEIKSVLAEDVFEFQNVKYILTEGDNIKIDTVAIESREFMNASAATAYLPIDIPQLNETSQFFSNESLPLNLQISETAMISVPTQIDGDKIYTSRPIWKYSEGVKEIHSTYGYSNNFTIPPHTKLTVKIHAILQKITTGYIATYKMQTKDKSLEVEGKWEGMLLNGFYTNVKYDEINQ